MTPKLETPQAIEERGTAKAKYTRFFWPVLRGMVLTVALCSFFPSLAGLLYEGRWEATSVVATGVFMLASLTLWAMAPESETLPAIEGKGTARQLRLSDWWLVTYVVIIGLGWTWACVFLYFSRQHPFFSAPVIAVTALIMTLYAAIALLVAWLSGGNWRTAFGVFFIALAIPGIVLRLGLLR